MAKKEAARPSTALAVSRSSLPSFMQEDVEPAGLEGIKQVITPPYLKIVQSQSTDLKREGFETGDVAIMPDQTLMPARFTITPILQYVQYQIINPREAVDLPMVRESSLDSRSPLAQRCRNLERFQCPEKPEKDCVCQSSMVFIVWIHELDRAASMMFKGAEWKTGKDWANKINLLGCSIYGGRYSVEIGNRDNTKGNWEGFVITVDKENAFVTEEQYAAFREQHLEMEKQKAELNVHDGDGERSSSDSNSDSDSDSDSESDKEHGNF